MSINNNGFSGLPDPKELEALAAEYFPEFAQNAGGYSFPDAVSTGLLSESVNAAGVANITPQQVLQTVPGALELDKEFGFSGSIPDSDDLYTKDWNKAIPYSFLDEARALYTAPQTGNAQQLSGKIPDNKSVAPLPGGGFSEILSPLVAGAPVKNESYSVFSSPAFLQGIRPAAGLSDRYSDLSISPAVVPDLKTNSGYFDVGTIRNDFPILSEKVNGKNLIWFDNAATTHKPKAVIDRVSYYYEHENSNVHRGAHALAARSTDAYEKSRETIARFINAPSSKNIVFVRGTTEAINLAAQGWGKYHIGRGDEIIVSHLEHHANIVPWQMIASEVGAVIRVIPVDDSGQIILSEFQRLLSPKTKLVSVTHVSNALGTVTPVADIIEIAHRHGAKVLIDGAQSISHMKIDVQAIDADFFVFSGHKIFGPTGIGALYGKEDILESMRPYQGGGNMIADVTFERTVYQAPPNRFEAGTGNIADAVGLGAALDYVSSIGIENIGRYEHHLLEYATESISRIPGVRIIGTAKEKASVLSFVLSGFSTEEVGNALSAEGIAVRSGHHCAQPILRRFGLESSVRPSFAFYNTCGEIDALAAAVWNLKRGRNPGIE